MQSIGQLLVNGIEFLSIWALFYRFHSLLGWTLSEIGFFYGFISMVFSLADASSKGFDLIPGIIRSGEFDRILLRPISSLIQIAGKEFTLRRVGRFLQGFFIFFWASLQLKIHWTFFKILLAVITGLSGIALFTGVFILQATLCFWTVESIEAANILTYGGVETSQIPLSIYPDGFRKFFTFVFPLGCISYFPLLLLMNKNDPIGTTRLFQIISPLFGFIFFLITLHFWNWGIRHYTSAGG